MLESRSPSHTGLSGIVLMEFRNTFKLITKRNRVVLVPKAGSVFVLRTCGFLVTLYGSQLCFRAVERAVVKFKTNASIDL